jgi:hypothetical protein
MKRGVRYRYYVSRAVTEGQTDLAGSIVRVPAVDVEEAVLDALHKLASTVDSKRWLSLLGPRPHVTDKLIEFPAIAPRDLAAPADASGTTSPPSMLTSTLGTATTACVSTKSKSAATPELYRMASARLPAMALASESRRLIEAVVERAAIQDGAIEIALTRGAAEVVGETTVITAGHKPPARVSRELIPPIEGGHPDARATRSDIKIKLLAGIAKARARLDELLAGRVLDIADLAQREMRSVRSTTMQLSLAFLAPSLVQAIAENRLPRGIGLTRLADLPSDWSQQFKMLGPQAPR